ncbi:MAG: CapA family protein, partial [Clostridia bacterium]|nr:CapA family protein [Clostridia bacterium]
MFDFELSKLKNSYVVSDKNKFDFSDCFNDVKAFLSESDYVLANLETPVSINSTDLTNEQYRFCAPFEFLEALKSSGVNYLSTANNHCLDRGIEGLVSTIDSLDKLGFDHNGTYKSTKGKKPLVIEKDGVKIGILSYTYGTNAFHNKIYLKN